MSAARYRAVALPFTIIILALIFIISPAAAHTPIKVYPKILRVIPHNSQGFTQGLFIDKDILYEGTGLYGQSAIFSIGLAKGNIINKVECPNYFGEGITIFKGNLYQLTWRMQKAIVYTIPALSARDTLEYKGEGWGLTADSTNLIMSNGSSSIYFRSPNFKITRTLPVTVNGSPADNINELEYARGYIYANVWYKNYILEISPATGAVNRIVDCAALIEIEKPLKEDNVLNGIAYNDQTGTFYLTGKRWRFIFEVSIPGL